MQNTAELKQNNMFEIIRIIKNAKLISKPDIASRTKLTSVTVHYFVNELVNRKICIEAGISKSNGGRKAILYKINDKFGYIIGMQISREYIHTYVYNLDMKQIYKCQCDCLLKDINSTLNSINNEIKSAIKSVPGDYGDCIGIGISIPGRADKNGVIINILNIDNWRNVPLKNIIEQSTGFKTYIDNDNNALVISSKWNSLIENYSNYIYITITEGVGTGVIINNELFYGSNNHGCEIGHTVLSYDNGKNNCLTVEEMICDEAVISSIPQTTVEKYELAKNKKSDITHIAQLAIQNNDTELFNVFDKSAGFIAITIENLVKMYDPNCVILQNNWLPYFPKLQNRIFDHVYASCNWLKRHTFNIFLNSNIYIIESAAACLVLDKILNYSSDNLLLKYFMKENT